MLTKIVLKFRSYNQWWFIQYLLYWWKVSKVIIKNKHNSNFNKTNYSFVEVLESHYDHPKPPRPASVSISTNQPKNVTFGTLPSSFRPLNSSHSQNSNHPAVSSNEVCFPVTEEAINTLKLEQYKSHTLEMENVEPIYDEIPWRPLTVQVEELTNNGDEAITEL